VVFLKVNDWRGVAQNRDRLAAAGTVPPSTDGFAKSTVITNHIGAFTGQAATQAPCRIVPLMERFTAVFYLSLSNVPAAGPNFFRD
jgi:hypothetical protein